MAKNRSILHFNLNEGVRSMSPAPEVRRWLDEFIGKQRIRRRSVMRWFPLAVLITAGSILPATAQTNTPATPTQSQITGAFGLVLGAAVDLSQYHKMGETTDKTPRYSFTPKDPLQGLTTYWFEATPKSSVIYRIWAQGDCKNDDACKKQQTAILDLLKKKYGQEEKEGQYDDFYDAKRMTRGNRSMVLKCTGTEDVTVNLSYTDDDLRKQADKERLDIAAKKPDAAGL
jgi:hypothetical protein